MSRTSRSSVAPRADGMSLSEILFAMLFAGALTLALLAAAWPTISVSAGAFFAMFACGCLCSATRFKGASRVLLFIVLALVFAALISASSMLRAAALNLVNAYIAAWDNQFDAYVMQIATPAVNDTSATVFAMVLGLVVALAVYLLASNHLAVTTSLVMAVFLGFGLVLHVMGMFVIAFLLLTGIALLTCLLRRGHGTSSSYAAPSYIAVLSAIVILAACVCIPFGGSPGMHEAKQQLIESVETARFGSDSLPQGDLARSQYMNVVPDTGVTDCLELSFEGGNVRELHLRGFTGDIYTGTGFVPMKAQGYEGDWTGLFAWLGSRGFSPLSQFADYSQLSADGGAQGDAVSIGIRNANRKYAYAPVVASSSGPGALLDLYRTDGSLFGNSASRFELANGVATAEQFLPEEWVYEPDASDDDNRSAFVASDRAYHAFALEKYVDVDPSIQPLIRDFFYDGQAWDASNSILATTTRIRSMLDASCSYRARSGSYPGGDYVTWFLRESRAGNSAAFAAAAVLAFREAGVPARYVEGYLLDYATAEKMARDGASTCTLSARNAHAWAEVYVDGAGWLPVEVTPGFYDRAYSSNDVIEIAREVAGKSDDETNVGSIQDGGDWTDMLPEELRPFAWVGLVILFMLVVLVVWGLCEAQRAVRCAVGRRKLQAAFEAGASSVLLYQRLKLVVHDAGVEIDDLHPLRSVDEVTRVYPEVHALLYRIAVKNMERERYGGVQLDGHQLRVIVRLCEKIEALNWEHASVARKAYLRYAHLYLIPLAQASPSAGKTRDAGA